MLIFYLSYLFHLRFLCSCTPKRIDFLERKDDVETENKFLSEFLLDRVSGNVAKSPTKSKFSMKIIPYTVSGLSHREGLGWFVC